MNELLLQLSPHCRATGFPKQIAGESCEADAYGKG